ncbi:trypsin-like peptidase domain-containing protein [Paracoccus sanguinis]|uniref:trypsin-like peptidase domain-containing protein n=1 Tax=Paracoccus sanguinis TaxID=1545044 RepID=UPI0009DD461F|nr:trypsin-like peptidase domain-containing protein [Paracoccus sanguinis]
METIADKLFYCTVRIEAVKPEGISVGTGFHFISNTSSGSVCLIVTNKHVVADAAEIKFLLHLASPEGRPAEKYGVTIIDPQARVFGHPNAAVDIAVIPISDLVDQIFAQTGKHVFFRNFDASTIPDAANIFALDSVEDVLFVGYPNGIWDSVNLLPVIRKGITATPVAIDYNGEKKFLLDASVFGGSSGSPVVLWSNGTYALRNGDTVIGSRFFLLGVVAGVFYRTANYEIVEKALPTGKADVAVGQEMLDLGIAFRAETIQETIEDMFRKLGIDDPPSVVIEIEKNPIPEVT